MIRVDHAGEKGAVDIYSSQIKNFKQNEFLIDMLKSEQEHLLYFDNLIKKNSHIKPTIMSPVWKIGAKGIGFLSSILGKKSIELCTEGVEDVIVDHYGEQIDILEMIIENYHVMPQDICFSLDEIKDILVNIRKFMSEELEHKDQCITAKKSFVDRTQYGFFSNLTKMAVSVSKSV